MGEKSEVFLLFFSCRFAELLVALFYCCLESFDEDVFFDLESKPTVWIGHPGVVIVIAEVQLAQPLDTETYLSRLGKVVIFNTLDEKLISSCCQCLETVFWKIFRDKTVKTVCMDHLFTFVDQVLVCIE